MISFRPKKTGPRPLVTVREVYDKTCAVERAVGELQRTLDGRAAQRSHVLRYLGARLAYGVLERRFAHLLLSFEEAQKYLLALSHGYLAEVAAQEGAHKLHLGVHHPAVGFHDVRGEHEQREEERVALALILLLG